MKFKTRLLGAATSLAICVAVGLTTLKAKAAEYFKLDYPPTSEWVDIYGYGGIEPNDRIGVFVDSNIGKRCIGRRDPNDRKSGMYGIFPVYKNDPCTPEKDGFNNGDKASILIWKDSEMELYFTKTDPNEVIFDSSNYRQRVDLELGEVFPYGWDDMKNLADNWLAQDCNESNNYCNECDKLINGERDGVVNFRDFAYIAKHWNPGKLEEWWYGPE